MDLGTVVRELPRPWRPMIGSEHLSLLLSDETVGGQSISADLTSALRAAHDELGVATVRAHAILCDDLGVYREVDGEPVHDFTGVDATYDALLALGLRPVVELSYMPRDLASDPDVTVFDYGAIVSPPKDWDRWACADHVDLVAAPGRPLRAGRGPRRGGRSRCGTSRTSRCSGPARATSSGACTTSR